MEFPIVQLLICDDAPQFKIITQLLALCWIHDARHYKKLNPYILSNCNLLESFMDIYWDFYSQLLDYQQQPSIEKKIRLINNFDEIFSTHTGFDALDERIAKTKAKKESLLIVLDHPEIPLHNNPAELGARKRVRKRVISYGTRSDDGTKAWDTFMTISATAKKLGVNFYNYIYDRILGAYEMLSLAKEITLCAEKFNMGASWNQPGP